MNIKAYIESGVLELYLLGALSEEEQKEVAAMLVSHPELQAELDAIEMNLISVAESNAPLKLDRSILDKALSKIDMDNEEETKVIPLKEETIVPEANSNNFLKIMGIAASVALFFSLALNYNLYKKVQNVSSELAGLRDQNAVFANDLEVQSAMFEETQGQLLALSDPNITKINLKGIEGREEALATVYWNSSTKQTFINVNNLPEPPEGMQYQLWALADGVPIDAGVFDVNGEIQLTKTIESAQTFAVTLEEAGGKPTPNLEQLYVIGNV